MKRKIAMILTVVLLMSLLSACGVTNREKLVALTFDDGPSLIYTTRLLDGLRERNARCTFFLEGKAAERYPDIVTRMWLDGNQVGNHTYNHVMLTTISDDEIKAELETTDKAIDGALGFDQSYMLRPPHGDCDERVLAAAGVPCICWSLNSYDWETETADEVFETLISQVQDGDIILMHDTHAVSAEAALRVVDELQTRGFELVTVSELCCRRGIDLQNLGDACLSAYPKFRGTDKAIAEPEITYMETEEGQKITLKGDSRGEVYYTVNGETPTPANSTLYTEPFTVDDATAVKAVSVVDWNGLRSGTVTLGKKELPVSTPVIEITDGVVSMSCSTPDAKIYYTTDNGVPTEKSTLYKGEFKAEPDTTYRARAYAPECEESLLNVLTYSKNGNVFSDVYVDDWYYGDVDRAVTAGVLRGVGETIFGPMENFSRAMLAAALYRMAGEPDVEGLPVAFYDVPEEFWCRNAIAWAYSVGIIKDSDPGCEDGRFRPRDNVTRQAMAAMMGRYLSLQGIDMGTPDINSLDGFYDGGNIKDAFSREVAAVCEKGIVQGFSDGSFRPDDAVLRNQAAIMLLRVEELQ